MDQYGLNNSSASVNNALAISEEHLQTQQLLSDNVEKNEAVENESNTEIVLYTSTEMKPLAIIDSLDEDADGVHARLLGSSEDDPPVNEDLLLTDTNLPDKSQEKNEKSSIIEHKTESPLRNLHNIVSHQVTDYKVQKLSDTSSAKRVEDKEEDGIQNLKQIRKEAGLSPLPLEKGRKSNKRQIFKNPIEF